MIIDITGIELTPGNQWQDCRGNGSHYDKDGNPLECCCDECDYMLCCVSLNFPEICLSCDDPNCPRINP